jgi:hypothetical protein
MTRSSDHGASDPVVSEPRDQRTNNNRAPHVAGLETTSINPSKEIRDPKANPNNQGEASQDGEVSPTT